MPINDSKNVLKTLQSDSTIEFAEEEIEYHYFGMTNDQYFQGMQLKDFSSIKAPEVWGFIQTKEDTHCCCIRFWNLTHQTRI